MKGKKYPRPIRTVTSFCICLVHDPEIVDKKTVLMVHNLSDAEMSRNEPNFLLDGLFPPTGKPAAVGLPGGGQKIEDMETPQDAVFNEVLEETGFKIFDIKHLFTHFKYIIKDSRPGKKIKIIPYFEVGKTPPHKLDPNQYVIDNHVYIFNADIKWEGSPLQKILRSKKREFIDSQEITQEEVDRFGMWVYLKELASEELESLNISEQGLKEIDLIGIFSLEYLCNYSKQPKKEIYEAGFYPSHLQRVSQGAEQMGIDI